MNFSVRTNLGQYSVAVVAIAVSVGLRSLLQPVLGSSTPFILLYPAVFLAALVGGTRSAVLTTVGGAVAADFFLVEPLYAFAVPGLQQAVQLIIFATMGLLVSWAISDRRHISARLEAVKSASESIARATADQLNASRERARLTERTAGVGVWEWDYKTGQVVWTEGIYDLLGLDPGSTDASLDLWLSSIFPDDLPVAEAVLDKFIAERSPYFYDEFRLKRHDNGGVVWLATQGRIIYDDSAPTRLFGVNYDITEKKERELKIAELNRELRQRVGELETIVDLAPVGIAVSLDPQCDRIVANPALCKMVGVEPGQNISLNKGELSYRHLKNGRVLEPHELPMQRAVKERCTIFDEELDIQRSDGSVITIYSYAAPVYDDKGEVVSCVAAQIDITERKQREVVRERELGSEQALRRQAEEANRLKDEFLATISHELRTPLNSIIGWTSMLRDANISDELRSRAIAAVDRGARSQSQLIEDLLDVSRVISGKLSLNMDAVDLSAVVMAAVETLRPAAAAKTIEIVTENGAEAKYVSGDRERLQQVVWNLLSNAVKFTPTGGRVDVSVRDGENHFDLVVEDTGKGISADFLPLVFDRFRQADGSITRAFTGLGLGLSIVRHLVELHGGTVSVESPGIDRGSTFTVRLPSIARSTSNEHALCAETGAAPDLKGLKVLIVDDETDAREILRFVLERRGAAVAESDSVADALEKAQLWQPNVIVSDIGMPGEDGYSLIERLREHEERSSLGRMAAIALTAYARGEDRERTLAAGFDAHISKPVEPADIVALVRELAAHSTQQQI